MGKRHAVIFAGIGGRGVLMAGQLFSQVGMRQYAHAVYFPTYTTEMRGGTCECTVILSDNPIGSPMPAQVDTLVMLDSGQLEGFVGRLRPGGTVIAESSNQEQALEAGRSDCKLVSVPAIQKAAELGDARAANLLLLGVLVQATGAIPAHMIESELEARLSGRGDPVVLARNLAAFRQGLEVSIQP